MTHHLSKEFTLECLAIVALFAWNNGLHLTQIPVWDTAMVQFSGAAFLANNGFSISKLLAQPTWINAGPNSYPLSPLTWLTALGLYALPNTVVYLLLHLAQLPILLGIAWLTHKLFPNVKGIGLAAVIHPVLQVQASYMYSELLLTLLTMAGIYCLLRSRFKTLAVIGGFAVLLKHAGVILVMAAVMFLVIRRDKGWVQKCFIVGIPASVAFTLITIATNRDLPGLMTYPHPYSFFLEDTSARLAFVPDLPILLGIALVLAVFVIGKRLSTPKESQGFDVSLAVACVVVSFTAFFLIVPIFATFWMLPRYFSQILPLLISWPLYEIVRWRPSSSPQVGVVAVTLIVAFLGINQSGILYPTFKGLVFAIVERDMSYRDSLVLQRSIAAACEGLPADVPKFVSRDMAFFLSYEELGYVSKPLDRVYFVLNTNIRSVEQLPPHSFLVFSNVTHGGEILWPIWNAAKSDKRFKTKIFNVPNEQSRYGIMEISRW